MRQRLTTKEAAFIAGVDPRSFARWARERGLEPIDRMRIGRSNVTLWSVSSLMKACLLDSSAPAC